MNNYVVGDAGGSSTGGHDATAAGTAIVGDTDGATVCNDPVCPDPPGASTSTGTGIATDAMDDGNESIEGDGNGGGGDTGLPSVGRAPCDPCETDAHCGGEPDFCVDLGGPSPVCTSRCFEAPQCRGDATCEPVLSVEGQAGEQCVPPGGCPDPAATTAGDAM